jgi:hypothetical protein
MGRELGSSRPSHRWVLPLLLNSGCHTGPTPGFSTPASPAEVDHGFLRIPGACYVAVDNRKAEAARDLDNGALVLRYLHMGHN